MTTVSQHLLCFCWIIVDCCGSFLFLFKVCSLCVGLAPHGWLNLLMFCLQVFGVLEHRYVSDKRSRAWFGVCANCIVCNLYVPGSSQWPFQGLSDLNLGDQKISKGRLEVAGLYLSTYAPIPSASIFGVGFGYLNTLPKGIWSSRVYSYERIYVFQSISEFIA